MTGKPHNCKPNYCLSPNAKTEQIAAADRDQHHSFTSTTTLSSRRQGSTFYQENEYKMP